MHYLGLVYWNEQRWLDLPEAERQRIIKECTIHGNAWRQSGKLIDGAPLHPTTTATSLCRPDGQLLITDGPFAETKEVLAGYHVLNCKDLDEAIAISGDWPGLKYGMTLELRPVMELE